MFASGRKINKPIKYQVNKPDNKVRTKYNIFLNKLLDDLKILTIKNLKISKTIKKDKKSDRTSMSTMSITFQYNTELILES